MPTHDEIAKAMPQHATINLALEVVGKAQRGEISQIELNNVMQGLQKRMGVSMDDFLKTETGKIFLQPAPTDLHTQIEMRKRHAEPGVEEPWDKSKSPIAHLDDNTDADADDLMKLAYAKMTKLGGGMTLDEALSMAMKERPDLLERSKQASLGKYY
jgi:hypothetical protein